VSGAGRVELVQAAAIGVYDVQVASRRFALRSTRKGRATRQGTRRRDRSGRDPSRPQPSKAIRRPSALDPPGAARRWRRPSEPFADRPLREGHQPSWMNRNQPFEPCTTCLGVPERRSRSTDSRVVRRAPILPVPGRHSSVVEQLFRKQQVLGSNPSVGSSSLFRAQEEQLSRVSTVLGSGRVRSKTC
jgi:hypothetical protein